jgi:hypothetical protein
MVYDFQQVELNARPPSKHDMFLSRFAPGPSLPVCGNPCGVALKRAMHLQVVIEITSGDFQCSYRYSCYNPSPTLCIKR